YTDVNATVTPGFVPMSMENPALEIEDFERFVEQYRARVLRFLFASVRDMDLAETLTQDCFWKAYRSRSVFRADCIVHNWLIRTATNLGRGHRRSRRFQFWKKVERVDHGEAHDWPDRTSSPEEKAAVSEQVRAVWEATKTLSEKQRTVFLLRFVEDLDIPEIAQSTGLTQNAVNVHLFRAVRGVRKRLGRSDE